MRAIDLTAYLVLDPVLCEPLGMVETARQAAAAGITIVQLRAPDWKKRRFAECARALLEVLRPYSVPLIINDHVDVALAVGAQGVHVGQKDLPVEDTRRLLGDEAILGLSVSTPEQCRQADPDIVDYIGIGPVWATATKPDADPALGPEGLRALSAMAPCPHVTIGGISAERLPAVKAAGAQGFAVVSAICGQPSPFEATRELIRIWKES